MRDQTHRRAVGIRGREPSLCQLMGTLSSFPVLSKTALFFLTRKRVIRNPGGARGRRRRLVNIQDRGDRADKAGVAAVPKAVLQNALGGKTAGFCSVPGMDLYNVGRSKIHVGDRFFRQNIRIAIAVQHFNCPFRSVFPRITVHFRAVFRVDQGDSGQISLGKVKKLSRLFSQLGEAILPVIEQEEKLESKKQSINTEQPPFFPALFHSLFHPAFPPSILFSELSRSL